MTSWGLKKFISLHEPIYVELIIEFYTSLEVNSNDAHILEFRLLGKNNQLTYAYMQRVFGFKKDGICNMPKSFDIDKFWTFLTDLPPPFRPKKGKAMFIKDLKFWLLHKVLCCVVFHKSESNQVSTYCKGYNLSLMSALIFDE